jgi:hypothetical protein
MSLAKFRKVSKGGVSLKKKLGDPLDSGTKKDPETKDKKNDQK